MTAPALFGRESELKVLEDMVDAVRERGAALVVRGYAGVGKTVLLQAAKERARGRGMLVLSATGLQLEANLPFAGLHQLLRRILSGADKLPTRQREALLAAFGMTDAAAPDLFLIALAALNLLSDAAPNAPLFLAVEDAQWLDPSSCEVLAFVARRLESDPIVLLFAVRDGCPSVFDDAGLPELRLAGLDDKAAGAVLDAHAPDLAPSVRERILREADGNPLALVELPAAVETEGLGEGGLPGRLPLTARLEEAFAARQSQFPAGTRTVLLVGAANDGGLVADVLRGASIVDGADRTIEDLGPAISAGLVEIRGTELKCRHPLVRSALYQAATDAERHAAHGALSEVFANQPDRRVWHQAASVIGTDEDVAADLEAAAVHAQRCGAMATAAAAMERAARLTADPARRGTRLLRASELAFEMGRADMVLRLLGDAEALDMGPLERARMAYIREMFTDGIPGDAARVLSLVNFAEQTRAQGDTDLALDFLRAAALRCFWADPGEEARKSLVGAAERMPVPDDDPRLLSILAFADPANRGAVVIERLSRLSPDGYDPDAARLLGEAANTIGAFDLSAGFLAVSVGGLREQGRLGLLPQVLVEQAWTAIHTVTWSVAVPAAEEATRLARELGQPLWGAAARTGEAMLAGLRGDQETAQALAAEAEKIALPMGASIILAGVQLARGVTALGVGRHQEAYEHLQRMFDPADPAYHPFMRSWGVGDLAEAAVQSGHRQAARAVVQELESMAKLNPSSWFQVAMLYARPLVADDADVEPLLQAALGAELARWPFFRARLLLAYGTWLRRQRRVVEARASLRAARQAFDALGTIPWGERARQELRAAGERSDRPAPAVGHRLTAQELQIAEMAAAGLSNREIGQKLYLSHRTVGSHLYRIFPKLGITSRHGLRGVLEGMSALAR